MKNQLSRFDIGMIIAFVVVALLGAGGWWWLSGQLTDTIADTQQAASDFKKYSQSEVYLPNKQNVRTLQNNIDLMTAQLDPIVASRLQSAKNGLKGVHMVDTVDWKHDLDEEVSRLNSAAATHGVIVPKNFYYGFSRYLNANPKEDATAVLKRQQIAVEAIANILIAAPVKAIINIKRTAEEDSASGPGAPAMPTPSGQQASDILAGRSVEAPGGVYTAYPLEFQFDADTESLRTVISQIMQSDYVFVVRSVMVQNSKLESPTLASLDELAGVTTQQPLAQPQPSIMASPGAVAAAAPAPTGNSTIGLQYLFGDETLHVRVQLDLIDWHGVAQPITPAPKGKMPVAPHRPAAPGANRTNNPTT